MYQTNEKKEKGITLVALVVTIVVLLILAGITITYVMGDNSIFNQASKSKLHTEIAKVEEQAETIYSSKLLQKVKDNLKDKPTMQEIVEGLETEGYTIEKVNANKNKVTGISLDKESMGIGYGKTKTIKVTLLGNTDLYTYYVKVDGKYYEMFFNDGAVTVNRTESELPNSEDTTTPTKLTVSSEKETIATAVVDNDTNIVTVTAKNTAGATDITITYGDYTKVCSVTVAIATKVEINSVRARIATGHTRWLKATATPETASQEFEWTSSNTEVATVDNNGIVTAKKKGETTITATTSDGSNLLSKVCNVTVDDAVEITKLTDLQSENTIAKDENGNLITVPGNFKVLTTEGTKVTQGIVIQDKEGNEFVWVPVDSISTGKTQPADDIRLGRYTFGTNGTPQKRQDSDDWNTGNHGWNSLPGNTYFYERINYSGSAIIPKNLEDFVTQTKANGGYYIGRYEANKGEDQKAKTQYDKPVWNQISLPKASSEAQNMYNNDYIESDLINSYSWDTAIVFIQKYSGNSNYANKQAEDSNKSNTGLSSDKECNIYDMALNYREWTTEATNHMAGAYSYSYVGRGGVEGPTSTKKDNRFCIWKNEASALMAFRPLLYIKAKE